MTSLVGIVASAKLTRRLNFLHGGSIVVIDELKLSALNHFLVTKHLRCELSVAQLLLIVLVG